MVKATINLPNGTEVTIDGTPEEVQSLLSYYGQQVVSGPKAEKTKKNPVKKAKMVAKQADNDSGSSVNAHEIVNLVKNCNEAEAIELQILDRASQVDRVLLPLFIVHEHLDNFFGLSSGDVSQITRDLGVPVSQPNASTTLTGTASKYVMADGVRKKGTKLTYKLSRRGVTYMKGVISGSANEK
jgi:hypothetical protein